ncbi:Chaperone protein DnaJ [Galdieria sulphuraria]|uniref:DnaJ (Hsp40) homolog, subfamily B n=1 Tax=Galdieria sulphuraria TaxID=130081 RepID=M2Y605_GALSU|nr:DnaJ (Hsp40) homolog, subfamily B [Galdieria sulphuraria]EME31413.1 DnaJ (Hsp40) homolog, subfamily B [Galdieria sulphuraria]GJD06569.1 Chaperone protein DnaJ [Galdieria sulphuraria]|eukprot:XP_005707933.1 DnaJ (Hsp40) homolog, subfamily B [Galdieria sulphuraria]
MENPYHVLGLSSLATDKEIQTRYRKLAFKFHPDRNPGQREEAERNFKRIKDAYDVLKQQRRKQFERAEPRTGNSARADFRQGSTKTQNRNPYTGQRYSGFSKASNRYTRPPRLLDIPGLQILVFTLVASTSIAIVFGDSWWKKLNQGKSFDDMMRQRHIFQASKVQLRQDE